MEAADRLPAVHDLELVIPSLPGFGFSGPTHERGWGPLRIAQAWLALMRSSATNGSAAHQSPDQLAGDIREFFARLQS